MHLSRLCFQATRTLRRKELRPTHGLVDLAESWLFFLARVSTLLDLPAFLQSRTLAFSPYYQARTSLSREPLKTRLSIRLPETVLPAQVALRDRPARRAQAPRVRQEARAQRVQEPARPARRDRPDLPELGAQWEPQVPRERGPRAQQAARAQRVPEPEPRAPRARQVQGERAQREPRDLREAAPREPWALRVTRERRDRPVLV